MAVDKIKNAAADRYAQKLVLLLSSQSACDLLEGHYYKLRNRIVAKFISRLDNIEARLFCLLANIPDDLSIKMNCSRYDAKQLKMDSQPEYIKNGTVSFGFVRDTLLPGLWRDLYFRRHDSGGGGREHAWHADGLRLNILNDIFVDNMERVAAQCEQAELSKAAHDLRAYFLASIWDHIAFASPLVPVHIAYVERGNAYGRERLIDSIHCYLDSLPKFRKGTSRQLADILRCPEYGGHGSDVIRMLWTDGLLKLQKISRNPADLTNTPLHGLFPHFSELDIGVELLKAFPLEADRINRMFAAVFRYQSRLKVAHLPRSASEAHVSRKQEVV